MTKDLLSYHKHLETITKVDLEYVRRKDRQYNASWKRRGGPGAFFTIVRPWDRLESIMSTEQPAWRLHDLFSAISVEGLSGPDGSVIACVRDLRRYLLLLEAHMTEELSKSKIPTIDELDKILNAGGWAVIAETFPPGTPEDGGHHEQLALVSPWYYHRIEARISPKLRATMSHSMAKLYRPVWELPAVSVLGQGEGTNLVPTWTDAYSTDHPVSYWLDISQCPTDLRSGWRNLRPELNLKEAEDMMEYIELYAWSSDRYVLRKKHLAWAQE